MQLSNGTEVTVRRYRAEDAEEIVNLIIRNFKEVNVKDYGEEAVKALVATHTVEWFQGVASYANVYVFCNLFLVLSFFWKNDGAVSYCAE